MESLNVPIDRTPAGRQVSSMHHVDTRKIVGNLRRAVPAVNSENNRGAENQGVVSSKNRTRSGRGSSGRKDKKIDSIPDLYDPNEETEIIRIKVYNPKTGKYEFEDEQCQAPLEIPQIKVLNAQTGEYESQTMSPPPGLPAPDTWVEPEGGLKSRETRRLEALERERNRLSYKSPLTPPGIPTSDLGRPKHISPPAVQQKRTTPPTSSQRPPSSRSLPVVTSTATKQDQPIPAGKPRPAVARAQSDLPPPPTITSVVAPKREETRSRDPRSKKLTEERLGDKIRVEEGPRVTVERAQALEAELHRARSEAKQAEDIMDQMRREAESLHREKQTIRQQNAELSREMQMLQERVKMAEDAMQDTDLFAEELIQAREQLENEKVALDRARAELQTQEFSSPSPTTSNSLESLNIHDKQ